MKFSFENNQKILEVLNYEKLRGYETSINNPTLVPLFGIFSFRRPATSAKMNCYTKKLIKFFVRIISIEWYLN